MAAPIIIDDPNDPRIAEYRAVRERDLVGRAGRFVAEGEVVLNLLAASGRYRARSLLIDAGRANRLAGLIARFDDQTPVYLAAQPVLDAIAGFHLHRGILAIGEAAAPLDAGDLIAGISPTALVLVLIGIGNHDNMGGLMRNAAAFGVEAVLLDPTCCDPLYRKAIRVSVGASLVIPWARWSGESGDLIAALELSGIECLALSPIGDQPLTAVRRPPRAALVLGAEGPGLPPALLSRLASVRIEMAGYLDSLNVATASAIGLHHLAFGTPRAPGG